MPENPKILLVDDEENLLAGVRRQLRGTPYDLVTAASGAEALEALSGDGSFAAIVSDMRMPGMNGIELLAEVEKT